MDSTMLNNPAFLAFRAGHKSSSAEQTKQTEPVKQVSVQEDGKTNSITVKHEEDK